MSSTRSAFHHRRHFHILSKMHYKAIEVRDDGHLVINQLRHNDDRQLFYEDDQGIIRSKKGDYAIDVPSTDAQAQAVPYQSHSITQQFTFHGHLIANVGAPHIVLDIREAKHHDGADVLGCNVHGNANQQWVVEYV